MDVPPDCREEECQDSEVKSVETISSFSVKSVINMLISSSDLMVQCPQLSQSVIHVTILLYINFNPNAGGICKSDGGFIFRVPNM